MLRSKLTTHSNSTFGDILQMKKKIQGKTALVTGASRGIGRAIAIELAKHGVQRLLLVARNADRLAEIALEIEAMGVEVVPLVVDLTDRVQVNVTISQAWRDYGPVHLLVNCAGVAHQAPFLQSQLSDVQEEIAINLLGMYTITRLIARRMVSQREGTIVNVASLMGKVAAPTMSTYSATKFAILGFTQALRGELAIHNVRVIALLPTLTDTDMVRDLKLFRWVVPMSTQRVASALIRGIDRDANEILIGWQSYLAVYGNYLAPRLLERVMQLAAPLPDRQQSWLRLGFKS
jgi:3-oxoacyl-[acyl-carrier protein] reductase